MKQTESRSTPCDQLLDARGLRCPMPLLKTRQALNAMEPGQSLRVLTSDPASVRDISAFASRTGIGVRVICDQTPFELLVTK